MLSRLSICLAGFAWALSSGLAAAGDDLSNRAFQIHAGAGGITSLKHTSDVADTDDIARRGRMR